MFLSLTHTLTANAVLWAETCLALCGSIQGAELGETVGSHGETDLYPI